MRPELLSAANIPKPLHGLNPRTIMGKDAWDQKRQEVYAESDYCCAACGVHKSEAKLHQWLEAHETFEINYNKGAAELKEIVALCHFCHAFIHSGLLRIRARKKEVTAQHVRNVMQHGCELLRNCGSDMFAGTAELCDLVSVDRHGISIMPHPKRMADWGKWVMIWDGKEYKGKFKSMSQWRCHYARK